MFYRDPDSSTPSLYLVHTYAQDVQHLFSSLVMLSSLLLALMSRMSLMSVGKHEDGRYRPLQVVELQLDHIHHGVIKIYQLCVLLPTVPLLMLSVLVPLALLLPLLLQVLLLTSLLLLSFPDML